MLFDLSEEFFQCGTKEGRSLAARDGLTIKTVFAVCTSDIDDVMELAEVR